MAFTEPSAVAPDPSVNIKMKQVRSAARYPEFDSSIRRYRARFCKDSVPYVFVIFGPL